MLTELSIRNFTILQSLTIRFAEGLTVLTGETGAGKSIIVDAIGVLLGDKASQEMIKTGSTEAQITGCFTYTAQAVLAELGITADDEIIIRRTISAHGKGRSYINDTTVSLATLNKLGTDLVSIYGQHEQQDLFRRESHLPFLDQFGGTTADATTYQQKYAELFSRQAELNRMKEKIRERNQRIEFLRYQIKEIDAAQIQPGEKEAIEEERTRLLNAARLQEASALAYQLLYDAEGSCLDHLSTVQTKAQELAQFDQSAAELVQLLDTAQPVLKDAANLLRSLRQRYEIDPERLSILDDRLELIRKLEKKYGPAAEIAQFRHEAALELEQLEQAEEKLMLGEETIKDLTAELVKLADALSLKRTAAAERMGRQVMGELRQLGFQKAEFVVAVNRTAEITQNGWDDIEFLFSANPGEPPKPLAKVASGGELSRIMLALKSIAFAPTKQQKRNAAPITLIFDEVDAGIGGVTAQHVGARLKKLAENHQVFCITHLPQIAALADVHLKVEKDLSGTSADVKVIQLEGKARQQELARMLSGRVTEGSLRHAQELLGVQSEPL
jgi:DNA repair protein RecN (Recombination protein N)